MSPSRKLVIVAIAAAGCPGVIAAQHAVLRTGAPLPSTVQGSGGAAGIRGSGKHSVAGIQGSGGPVAGIQGTGRTSIA